MIENLNVFDFNPTEEEMAIISTFDKAESGFFSHYEPQTVEWFMSLISK